MNTTQEKFTLDEIEQIIKHAVQYLKVEKENIDTKLKNIESISETLNLQLNQINELHTSNIELHKITDDLNSKAKYIAEHTNYNGMLPQKQELLLESKPSLEEIQVKEELVKNDPQEDRIAALQAKQKELDSIVHTPEVVEEKVDSILPVANADDKIWHGVSSEFKIVRGQNVPKSLKEQDPKFDKLITYLKSNYNVGLTYFKEKIIANPKYVINNIAVISAYITE